MFTKMMSNPTKINRMFQQMTVQFQHFLLDEVEPKKAQGYDKLSLVTDTFTVFTPSDQYHAPIKWEHFFSSDDVEEDELLKMTKSTSETKPSKFNPSSLQNSV